MLLSFPFSTTTAQEILTVIPNTIQLDLVPGYLEVVDIKVMNTFENDLQIQVEYDTTWVDISPFEFSLLPGNMTQLLVFFFIPTGQTPVSNGSIVFKNKNNHQILNKIDLILDSTLAKSPYTDERDTQYTNNDNYIDPKILELQQQIQKDQLMISDLQSQLNKKDLEIAKLLDANGSNSDEFVLAPFPKIAENQSLGFDALNSLYKVLLREMNSDLKNNKAVLDFSQNKIYFSISGEIAFISGGKYLRLEGERVLNRFSSVLKNFSYKDFKIMVVGHTDSVQYKDGMQQETFGNWELSALRSVKVIKHLQKMADYPGTNLLASSQASYSPIAPNNTKTGRVANRRIEIIISY